MLRATFILLMSFMLQAAAQAQITEAAARTSGQALNKAFFANDLDTVWTGMNDKGRAMIKTRQALADFRQKVSQQLGAETALLDETVTLVNGLSVYQRRARFEKFGGPVLLHWAMRPD